MDFSPAIARKPRRHYGKKSEAGVLQLKSDQSLEELARMFNAVISGWFNYYGRFYPSAFEAVGNHINRAIVRWAMRKFKSLRGHKSQAMRWVKDSATARPYLFAHWRVGFTSVAR